MLFSESEENIVGSWRKEAPSHRVVKILEILENPMPAVFPKT